jgi:hypothetical protein
VAHGCRITAMRFQVFGEVHHRLVVSPLGSKQQSLGLQVVYYGDVVLPAPQAGLVDAHSAHRAHVVQLPGLVNVVLEAPPQRLVCTAQQLGRLAHRQLSAKRQSQGLEQRGEALARPRHAHLRGLAAAAARHTWHIGVQPRLELDKALASMNELFAQMYAADIKGGRPSIAPEKLLRAMLMQVLYSVRSERQLMEQTQYNLLFRWFIGLAMDDAVWVPTVFSKNRERLIEHDAVIEFFNQIVQQA